AVGGALFTVGTSAIITFTPTYLIRLQGFSTGEAGAYVGIVTGLAAGPGVLAGGWISSTVGKRDPRVTLWIAAAGLILGAPCLAGALNTDSRTMILILLSVPLFLG